MDTKAAFEKWWEEESGQADICAGSNIGSTIKMIAFDAWRGSRAAITMDLEPLKLLKCDLTRVAALLDSHGIRIKGKTE